MVEMTELNISPNLWTLHSLLICGACEVSTFKAFFHLVGIYFKFDSYEYDNNIYLYFV